MMKLFKKAPLAAGVVIALASGGAQAISAGTDLNLSGKAKAGAMGGAAYTMPQEASAAVFGNPATLTQFKGFNMNFGASYLGITSVDVTTSNALGTDSGTAHSDADDYIIPDFGMTLELAPGLVLGTGLEVDAGLGADYRDDPVGLTGLPGGALGLNAGASDVITLPLMVELISFNANIGLGYQATERLSLGASVTIGFGLAQLGTTGPTTGISGALGAGGAIPLGLEDFGGTSSSVHDIGFGFSLGSTYALTNDVMLSAAYKSPVEYNFSNIVHTSVPGATSGGDGFQDLRVQQPAEVIVGIALDNVLAQGLLIEADVIWKDWSHASTYEDVYDDQFLLVFGGQYQIGAWSLRAGYSWAEDVLNGLGTLPLGGPLGTDVVKVAQMSLLPVIWEHTVTAGVGYQFTDAVSLDGYVAYAFGEEDSRDLNTVGAVLGGATPTMAVEVEEEIMIGAGITISMP